MTQHSDQPLQRTPLYECHLRLGAKMVPFAGWEMPVQYSGLVDEHLTVRAAAGLFDVSHMGELRVRGKEAFRLLQYVTSNDVSKLYPGRAQYSLLLNEQGGVVDDIIVYKFADDDYFICVNASNADKDFAWICKHNRFDTKVENHSASYAQVAIQGPKARKITAKLYGVDAASISLERFAPFHFQQRSLTLPGVGEIETILASTGYTGEDGFEIFCPANAGATLWEELLRLGKDDGIKPIGLGARDTLRLEVCYPLHGHELRDDVSALQSGGGWVIKFDKDSEFVGREPLLKEKTAGLKSKLVGLEVVDRGIVRENAKIFSLSGEEIGWSTSGTQPPSVQKAIAMGFVPAALATPGSEVQADVRGRMLKMRVIKMPFYQKQVS